MVVNAGDSLLDAEQSPIVTPHRITIKTDQKRWWPKTIYHTYWSRMFFWIQRNIVWALTGVAIMSIAGYLLLTPNHSSSGVNTYNTSAESILRSIKEKLNDPSFFNYASHQEKLKPYGSDYIAPDTHINWHAVANSTSKVKAAFVALVQEKDIYKLRGTMIELERTFNEREGYPWVIISDQVFSKKFREWITSASRAPVYFGQAPAIEWQEPYWVDIKKAEKNMKQMVKDHNIDSGESMSWRRMTRYNMGFIAHHPLLKDLEYYWKVQPGSRYTCDIPIDPFKKMKSKSQKLSFALTIVENHENINEFFNVVNGFIVDNKDMLQPTSKSIFKGLLHEESRKRPVDPSNPLGEHIGHFTNCMIYNNFAIFSLQFLRSKEYTKYFDELDASGGFFYHKWGDALPQTIAAGLLLKRSEIAFDDVPGYTFAAGAVCPRDISEYAKLKCTCTQNDWRTHNMRHCSPTFMRAIDGTL
ncbi:uncharacterized protein ATC70_006483 [Mucor velutinosus]|uniref:Uncharacterized protein n=1 Tax=Mucor velutinosus TaxID=708070 RepID=A0AAN7DSS8_9FUNG|nr:hypothetical protein ATC70_006483 [Mucor velutinosus]